MTRAPKPPCERCGATRCTEECRHLLKAATPGKCEGCAQPIAVGEFMRLRANPNVRKAYFRFHPRCHAALYPSASPVVESHEQAAAISPAVALAPTSP